MYLSLALFDSTLNLPFGVTISRALACMQDRSIDVTHSRPPDGTDLALAAKSSSKLQQFDNGTSVCTTRAWSGCSLSLPFLPAAGFFLPAELGAAVDPAKQARFPRNFVRSLFVERRKLCSLKVLSSRVCAEVASKEQYCASPCAGGQKEARPVRSCNPTTIEAKPRERGTFGQHSAAPRRGRLCSTQDGTQAADASTYCTLRSCAGGAAS